MQTFLALLKLLPALLAAVQSLEAAVPASGCGSAKADLLIGICKDVAVESADMAPMVQKLIDRIVALFKAVGAFKSGEGAK